MGAEPWHCFVQYQSDVNAALQEARQKAFDEHLLGDEDYSFSSVDEAVEEGPWDGPCSIIDIQTASPDCFDKLPDEQYRHSEKRISLFGFGITVPCTERLGDSKDGVAYRLSDERLVSLFGTAKPSREQVESQAEGCDFSGGLGRGQCIYVVTYDNDKPSEIYFGGVSYD